MEGVYLAFFRLESRKTIETGALGRVEYRPGLYVYVGSAMNSVERRLERHFSSVESSHWHIDYFSRKAGAADYLVIPEGSELECRLAEILSEIGEPVKNFGCSDCSCGSHLFRF